jgi:hypothetical protein
VILASIHFSVGVKAAEGIKEEEEGMKLFFPPFPNEVPLAYSFLFPIAPNI